MGRSFKPKGVGQNLVSPMFRQAASWCSSTCRQLTCPGKSVTRLVKVTCAYGDAVIGQAAHAAAPAAVIQRLYELTNGMGLRRL